MSPTWVNHFCDKPLARAELSPSPLLLCLMTTDPGSSVAPASFSLSARVCSHFQDGDVTVVVAVILCPFPICGTPDAQ